MKILSLILASSLSLSAVSELAVADENSQTPTARNAYYLALGDSVTYGYQNSKAAAGLPPSGFNTGFVDDLSERLRQVMPSLVTVNYGCPGESTDSFIATTAQCPWTLSGGQLHDSHVGSQLDAAIQFLNAHKGEVKLISLTLWGIDVAKFVKSCAPGDFLCVQAGAPGLIGHIQVNLQTILIKLRAAAPRAEIVVTGAWDSFIGAFAIGDPLFVALNGAMAETADSSHAKFADAFSVFNPTSDVNTETKAMCRLTLLCSVGDSHPSDTGYQALADVVFETSWLFSRDRWQD